MLVALILVSAALAIALGILIFNRPAETGGSLQKQLEAESKARTALESELDKRRRDLDEQRAQLTEVKDQLKQAKRKLYDQKGAEKDSHDLVKARTEVERSASIQLENVRAELAVALTELERLRADRDAGRSRKPPPRQEADPVQPPPPQAAAAPTPVVAAPPPDDKPRGRYRDLNDADRERMERLDHQANKDRQKAAELEKEVKRLKGRLDGNNRTFTSTKSELALVRDKYKALEKRLNRILLERDLMQRAIKDLEKLTGAAAGRTELTADEIAASDRKVEESAQVEAEIRAAAERPGSIVATDTPVSADADRPEAPAPSGPQPVLTGPDGVTEGPAPKPA